ncbi:glycosyltransferase [Archaeoglobus veneficus]|uniref:Glycosyl transferase family 2 n=1 Tax=Archaeoglobus veneficus (strain DSM 11195 / SNP6) TaxID=693661 RepID=F2KN35_ARCVS|nr:glycosyltransferase family 2 protein [Archaeoglobus veneficus]AEA47311.1 glycosyl transferase family 2 [Archaeoglobus veneficus SNP6]
MNVSIIIAAYRHAGCIEHNVRRFGKRCEVIVAADEPEKELLEVIEKYGLKASVSEKRRGKWRALNDAAKLATGDILIFLDSDTRLECNIEDIIEMLRQYDAVEVRKEVKASTTIQNLANIDYLNMYIVATLASKLKASLGLNGAAFGIRRNVFFELGGFRRKINEDTDLGIRLGLHGFKVGVGGRATTKAPSTLKEWFAQRERWAVGGAEVFIENFGHIIRRPALWLPALFLLFPAIAGFIVNMFISDDILTKLLYLILPVMLFLPPKVLALLMFALFQKHLLQNLLAALTAFLVWVTIEVILALKMKWKIDFKLLPVFYFFYSPLWMMLCLTAFFRVGIARFRGRSVEVRDWIV